MSKVWLDMFSLAIVVFSALLVSVKMFTSTLRKHGKFTAFRLLGLVFSVYIGYAAIRHLLSRDYFLPFLGPSAFPCGMLAEKTPYNYNSQVQIHVRPNTNVIFWAAEENRQAHEDDYLSPWRAYGQYTNAGVTHSDANGLATLRFRRPVEYNAMLGGKRDAHVHYRVCSSAGMLGRVRTHNLDT
jgi:hypothetical protein